MTSPPSYTTSRSELEVYFGLEERTDPSIYRWHGLRRAGDARHPMAIFQYTLSGRGAYRDGATLHDVTPGNGFIAVVPSDHEYFLPESSAQWTFFFFITRHPYVVSRIIEQQKQAGPLVLAEPDSVMIEKAVQFFEGVARNSFGDDLARESAMFDFLFEYERHSQQRLFPKPLREDLLGDVRDYVIRHLAETIDVEALAERRGMSRSHFTHYFRATTGLAPARYVTDVRLQETSRLLLQSPDKLDAIARKTGFADANHLCKVFRRHRHMSPGEFRRQLRYEAA